MLHPIAGGAAARPFVTHHNTLDMKLYLRIAPELYLKRLLVGGFEKVFEIGRVFRNEGISPRHNPEFTMMELYWAYVDYRAVMDLTEELFVALAKAFCKDGRTMLGERTIDLNGPFARKTYHELVGEHARIDPADAGALRRKADELGLKEVRGAPEHKVLEALFETCVEPNLVQPTFVTLYPTAISPLSKPCPDRPDLVERFELFMNGWELANAFSELNDPIDQRRRFEAQVASKDPEAPGEVDEDYLRALEHGMPPAGGLGIGIDRSAWSSADSSDPPRSSSRCARCRRRPEPPPAGAPRRALAPAWTSSSSPGAT
jgi:lysyl-tRNA synthetase class 2